MNRTLDVLIDKSTWPKKASKPVFPASFSSGLSVYDVNIPALLLKIGYLTTPTFSTGVSLSEFWAWVRYLPAITNDYDIRVTKSFSELDAHQKTILSDDFGMGVPMLYLTEKLSLNEIVDGNYFIKKIAASLSVTHKKSGKRGPNKTPDFVAKDIHGNWHVIECKGTQSGTKYSDGQLGLNGNKNTGGIIQKQSIIFPSTNTGQRLACGLSIGIEDKNKSVLKIIDPVPEEPFEVKKKDMGFADDAIIRGEVSKLLRLSGLEITAERVASPLGNDPTATYYKRKTDEDRRKLIVTDREIRSLDEMNRFLSGGDSRAQYHGKTRVFDLPRKIMVGDTFISKVIVKQSINMDMIRSLLTSSFHEEPIYESVHDLRELRGTNNIISDDLSAKMNIGSMYRAELILER